jgi:hypothetical protein
MESMSENRRKLDAFIGLAILGSSITGVAGLILALFALFGGDLLTTGVCLVAAALSFGLLANALLRT